MLAPEPSPTNEEIVAGAIAMMADTGVWPDDSYREDDAEAITSTVNDYRERCAGEEQPTMAQILRWLERAGRPATAGRFEYAVYTRDFRVQYPTLRTPPEREKEHRIETVNHVVAPGVRAFCSRALLGAVIVSAGLLMTSYSLWGGAGAGWLWASCFAFLAAAGVFDWATSPSPHWHYSYSSTTDEERTKAIAEALDTYEYANGLFRQQLVRFGVPTGFTIVSGPVLFGDARRTDFVDVMFELRENLSNANPHISRTVWVRSRVERTLSDEKNAAIITKDIRQAFDSAIDEICDEAGIGLGKRPEKSDYFYG